jgi:hypothetical protein
MQFRDIAGQPIEAGDSVFFGTAFGQAVVGSIQKTDTILADSKTPPLVHVGFVLSLPAAPNGLVGGILKIVPPKQEPLISE